MNEEKPLRRLTVGDVFEMKTSNGFAYGQLILRHKGKLEYGPLIRVVHGFSRESQCDACEIASRPTRFVAFCPINSRFELSQIRKVGNAPVPEDLLQLPRFKATNDIEKRRSSTWYVWDGEKTTKVGPLPHELDDLPLFQITSFPLFVERVEKGWHPRDVIQ